VYSVVVVGLSQNGVAAHENENSERRAGGKSHSRMERESRRDGKDVAGRGKTVRQRIATGSVQIHPDDDEHAEQDPERGSDERRRAEDVGSVEA